MPFREEVKQDMKQRRAEMSYARQQTMIMAATLYYDENLTQAEIGERLGISRVTVNRILRDSRRFGIVEIQIKGFPADETQESKSSEGIFPETETGDVRTQILQITQELYAKGWITATGGNVSARTDEDKSELWITPGGTFKGSLHTDMLVNIDLEGTIRAQSDFTPSSEWRVHCAIYRSRPDIQAVIHTHAPQAIQLALTGTPFLPISTEAAYIGNLPIVPFILPGTPDLGEAVAQALDDGVAVLMQNHGLVVVGLDLRQAANLTSIIESTAEAILECKSLGITPSVLPDDIVRRLRESAMMKG